VNYIDQETAACRRSLCVAWSARQIPMAVISVSRPGYLSLVRGKKLLKKITLKLLCIQSMSKCNTQYV
jgi:hypothetical protein